MYMYIYIYMYIGVRGYPYGICDPWAPWEGAWLGWENYSAAAVAVAAVAAVAVAAAAVARLRRPVPLADIRNALWFGGGALFLRRVLGAPSSKYSYRPVACVFVCTTRNTVWILAITTGIRVRIVRWRGRRHGGPALWRAVGAAPSPCFSRPLLPREEEAGAGPRSTALRRGDSGAASFRCPGDT
mgnify:CR=1 FL=1